VQALRLLRRREKKLCLCHRQPWQFSPTRSLENFPPPFPFLNTSTPSRATGIVSKQLIALPRAVIATKTTQELHVRSIHLHIAGKFPLPMAPVSPAFYTEFLHRTRALEHSTSLPRPYLPPDCYSQFQPNSCSFASKTLLTLFF
jgi:hypothetical protein